MAGDPAIGPGGHGIDLRQMALDVAAIPAIERAEVRAGSAGLNTGQRHDAVAPRAGTTLDPVIAERSNQRLGCGHDASL